MTVLRKYIAILLIALFLYNSAGYYIVFTLIRNSAEQQIKDTIKRNISPSSLIKITFKNEKDINWTKQGKEFSLNGEMYDIIKQEISNNLYIYYCVHDFKDSKIYKSLYNIISHNILNGKTAKKKAEILLQLIIKILFANIYNVNFQFVFSKFNYNKEIFHIIIRNIRPDTPPPITFPQILH
ncbi:MAG: hypothetical protein Kow0068_02590 [Marinilabiliales bacterium]